MTSPIALPAPAERLLRAAAGRRALQLALLLGGLIGLGLLCGGQAHADDTPGPLTPRHAAVRDAAKRDTAIRDTAIRDAATKPVRDLRDAPDRVLGEVRTRVVEPVREKVVRPVAETVRQVTEPVGELTGGLVEGLTQAAPKPLPDRPPKLPGLPGLPGGSDQEPAPAEPPGTTAPAEPVTSHPAPEHRKKHPAARPHSTAPAGPTAYDTVPFSDVRKDGGAYRAAAARHTAAQPAAPGAPSRPDGAPVANASAGDGSSTRHGDLHAAAFGSRVPVLLPPGALAPGGTAPVIDRHRDIPEFPG